MSSTTNFRVFKTHQRILGAPINLVQELNGIVRGGDVDDEEDERNDDSISQFIASFEAELTEIRLQAEMEAELEINRLRAIFNDESHDALIDESQRNVFSESEETKNYTELIKNYRQSENDEIVERCDDNDIEVNEGMPKPLENMQMNGTHVSNNRDDTKLTENETYAPESREVHIDLDEGNASLDDFPQHHTFQPVLQADDQSIIEENITAKAKKISKKERHSKSKKASTLKDGKRRSSALQVDTFKDDHGVIYHSNDYAFSSPTLIQKNIKTVRKSFQYYLQTDLFRAGILFFATVMLSLWMQRLQKQLEAQAT